MQQAERGIAVQRVQDCSSRGAYRRASLPPETVSIAAELAGDGSTCFVPSRLIRRLSAPAGACPSVRTHRVEWPGRNHNQNKTEPGRSRYRYVPGMRCRSTERVFVAATGRTAAHQSRHHRHGLKPLLV